MGKLKAQIAGGKQEEYNWRSPEHRAPGGGKCYGLLTQVSELSLFSQEKV